jgi:nucleoid DNA-binding protein
VGLFIIISNYKYKGEKMNKGELVEAVAKKVGMPKAQVDEVIKTVIETIAKTVRKENVQLVGLGTFKPVTRKARMGINPATQKKIKIPSRKTVKFSVSANLKRL